MSRPVTAADPAAVAEDVLCREILVECGRAWLSGQPSVVPGRMAARLSSTGRLVSLAYEHGMTSILLGQLQQGPGGEAPGELMSALRAAAVDLTRRSLHLTGELVRVMDELEAAGVRALAYKGPVLALTAYGDLGVRRFSDLDVLVHPADVGAASAVLAASGYAAVHEFSAAEAREFERLDGDYPFVHRDSGILLELHCRVASTRFVVDLPTAALWAESDVVVLAGRRIRTPSPRHHLLVLAVHGAKHRWRRLEWLVAFAALARAVDGDGVMDAAQRARAVRELLLALTLTSRVLGVDVPGAATAGMDATVVGLAGRVEAELRRGDGDAGADANLWFNFRLRRGAPDRLRYAVSWLVTPTPEDWRAMHLPPGLHGMHRVLRPMRLLWRYLPKLWRRGRRSAAAPD